MEKRRPAGKSEVKYTKSPGKGLLRRSTGGKTGARPGRQVSKKTPQGTNEKKEKAEWK